MCFSPLFERNLFSGMGSNNSYFILVFKFSLQDKYTFHRFPPTGQRGSYLDIYLSLTYGTCTIGKGSLNDFFYFFLSPGGNLLQPQLFINTNGEEKMSLTVRQAEESELEKRIYQMGPTNKGRYK